MNAVRQIVNDTKGKDERVQIEITRGEVSLMVEGPEQVMAKIQQQATYLGPVLEQILREMQVQGQSHWGLNE